MPEGIAQRASCGHLYRIEPVEPSNARGCQECLRTGSSWVHLRRCLTCGNVACCDASPKQHARAHAHIAAHPLVGSVEPGEDWRWCYADQTYV